MSPAIPRGKSESVDGGRPFWPVLILIVAVATVVLVAVGVAASRVPDPWTRIGGGLSYRCEGTTAIYKQSGLSDQLATVPNDARCAR